MISITKVSIEIFPTLLSLPSNQFILRIFFIIFITHFISFSAIAQTDSIAKNLKISGYIEMYYGYDFDNPNNHNRPSFLYSYHRHNEVNLNIGLVKAAYQKDNIRANFGLMAGTYVNRNLAHEPGTLRNIFEANVGVRLLKNKSLWLDVGVMPSHIGFESAIGMDCRNMTRSMIADNTPYYESGAKLSYETDNEKWLLVYCFSMVGSAFKEFRAIKNLLLAIKFNGNLKRESL